MSPCTSDADIRRFAMALRGQSPDEYNAEDNHTRHTAEKQIETALQVTGFVMGTPRPWNNKQADATGPWPSLFAVHPSVAVVIDREGDWWRRTGESWDFGDSWELFDKKTDVWRAFEISLRSTSCFAPFSTVEANMKRLVNQSSLGAESTRAAMESVSPENARRLVQEAARRESSSAPTVDPAPAEPAEKETKAEVFEVLRNEIAFSSMDWGANRDTAVIYGIICGWDDENSQGDDLDAMDELAKRFSWDPRAVAQLRDLRKQWVHMTSSSVDSAPNKTGPWQRVEDVPPGVRARAVDAAGNWNRHGCPPGRALATNAWIGSASWNEHSPSRDWANLFAPFVADGATP